ncbi:MAG: hypothetical protein ACC707_06425 [Thiohalomonadales bacterium]
MHKITSKINLLWSVGWIVSLTFSLPACNNSGDSGPWKSLAPENYHFYSANGGLYAVDPRDLRNPIELEPPTSDIMAPVLMQNFIVNGDSLNTRTKSFPMLVYAKNGQLWRVNALLDNDLSPEQFTQESNSFDICWAGSGGIPNPDSRLLYDMVYIYTTPGENGVCIDNQQIGFDNMQKFIFASDSGIQSPSLYVETSQPEPSDVVYSYSKGSKSGPPYSFTTVGQLVFEDSSLVWYDGERSPASKIILASNISFVQNLYQWRINTGFLNVDGELRQFDKKTKTLGPSLHTFPPNSDPYNNLDFSRDDDNDEWATIIDSSGIYRMPIDGSQRPKNIFKPASDTPYLSLERTTTNRLILRIDTSQTSRIVSLRKNDGSLIELASVDDKENFLREIVVLEETIMIAVEGKNPQILFTTPLGNIKKTLANTLYIQPLNRTRYDDNSTFADIRFFTATLQNETEILFSVFNFAGNFFTNIGSVTDDSASSTFTNGYYNLYLDYQFNDSGSGIFSLANKPTLLFYANINQNNSLAPIASNAEGFTVISQSWYNRIN